MAQRLGAKFQVFHKAPNAFVLNLDGFQNWRYAGRRSRNPLRKTNELYHKMLCLIQIYWNLGFSPKRVFSESGLNSGQDQVAEPVNLCTVAGVDNGGGIDLLDDCWSCQDAVWDPRR